MQVNSRFHSLAQGMGFGPGEVTLLGPDSHALLPSGATALAHFRTLTGLPIVVLTEKEMEGGPAFDAVALHELGHAQQWREGLLSWPDGEDEAFHWRGERPSIGTIAAAWGNARAYVSLPWEADAWRRATLSPDWRLELYDADACARAYRRSLEIALEDSK